MRAGSEDSVRLRDWQLLDWRFLVPAEVRRVGYVGQVSTAELTTLQCGGLDLVADPSPNDSVQVAIVTSADLQSVDRALDALEPGGWLLLRLKFASAPLDPRGPFRRRGWRRRLAQRGLRGFRAYWHAPDRRRCAYVVNLEDATAVRTMLRRFQGVRFGLLKSLAARL